MSLFGGISEDRQYYLRILIIGIADIIITLPLGIISMVVETQEVRPFVFYPGWDVIHTNWGPQQIPSILWKSDIWEIAVVQINYYVAPFTALWVFCLFGMTRQARTTYRRPFKIIWEMIKRRTGTRSGREPDAQLKAQGKTSTKLSSFVVAVPAENGCVA